jgi:hypothetical protein
MPNFQTVFGSEISVSPAWRNNETQLNGYAGATGVTGMRLGTRGRMITVSGTVRHTDATFAAAKAGLVGDIDSFITTYGAAVEDTWQDGTVNYSNVVFLRMEPIPSRKADGTVGVYHWTGAACYCKFIAYFWQMI